MAAHTNTSQLLYIIAEKGKNNNNKKVTTIKESASVYSGKTQQNVLPYQMPFKTIERKAKRVCGDLPSNGSFRKLPHKGGTLSERRKKNGHHLHVDSSEFVSHVGA